MIPIILSALLLGLLPISINLMRAKLLAFRNVKPNKYAVYVSTHKNSPEYIMIVSVEYSRYGVRVFYKAVEVKANKFAYSTVPRFIKSVKESEQAIVGILYDQGLK